MKTRKFPELEQTKFSVVVADITELVLGVGVTEVAHSSSLSSKTLKTYKS